MGIHHHHGEYFYNDLMRCLDASSSRLKPLVVVVLLAGCLMPVRAQQLPPISRPAAPASPGQAPNPSDDNDEDSMARRAMAQQARRRNDQRQQDIVKDAAKLVVLTQQLKAEMDKSGKDKMSLSTIKKTEEIEKLAKSIKEKMKGS